MSVHKSVALLHVADYFRYLERLSIGALMPNRELSQVFLSKDNILEFVWI